MYVLNTQKMSIGFMDNKLLKIIDKSYILFLNYLLIGTTKLIHNKNGYQEITHCPSKNCFELIPQYTNSMDQIKAVIGISESCQQQIQVYT